MAETLMPLRDRGLWKPDHHSGHKESRMSRKATPRRGPTPPKPTPTWPPSSRGHLPHPVADSRVSIPMTISASGPDAAPHCPAPSPARESSSDPADYYLPSPRTPSRSEQSLSIVPYFFHPTLSRKSSPACSKRTADRRRMRSNETPISPDHAARSMDRPPRTRFFFTWLAGPTRVSLFRYTRSDRFDKPWRSAGKAHLHGTSWRVRCSNCSRICAGIARTSRIPVGRLIFRSSI